MDTNTEIVYTKTSETKKTCGTTLKYRKSFFLRCGVMLIIFLTFYVMLTFYNQLKQASELLLDIKQRNGVFSTNNTVKWRANLKPDERKTEPNLEIEFDNNIFDRILDIAKTQNDTNFSEDDLGQAIRRRFQENVYMIRKRFYESHQSKTLQGDAQHENAQKNTKVLEANTHYSSVNLAKNNKIPQISDIESSDPLTQTRVGNSRMPRQAHVENTHNNHAQISRGNNVEQKEKNDEIAKENQNISRGARAGKLSYTRGLHESRAENSQVSQETNVNVLIIAYHRSGSSFLGEMFNRDPNVFYIFEPIHTIDSFLDARRRFPILYDTLIRHLLDTIFNCDFTKHPLFVNTLTSSPFRLKSQSLSSKELCDPRVNSYKMHLCRRLNATLLSKICRTRPHTVIKTIRMAHWENLDFLTDSWHTSFRVIHLVRDPRGIIASRVSWILEKFSRTENSKSHEKKAVRLAIAKYVRIIAVNLCQQMANDINDWTKRSKFGRPYAMVRYEDVSRKPLAVYNEISRFAGVDQSKVVIGWLENNTKSSNFDYYSTTRNSSAVPHMWRRRLTMPLVDEIQKNCAQVMRILGYKFVKSDKELSDMRVPLVVDWDNKGFLRTKPYSDKGLMR